MAKDFYDNFRGLGEHARLGYQHFLFNTHLGYNVHPSAEIERRSAPRIAEIACGSCTWLFQVADELGETAQIDGFDVSLEHSPPQWTLPKNVTIRQWNVFDPLPDGLEGQYDAVHIRLLIVGLPKEEDAGVLVQKFSKMLKPGGHLQWDELVSATMAYDPTLEPHTPGVKEIDELNTIILDFYEGRSNMSIIYKLPQMFTENGLLDVQIDQPSKVRPEWQKTWHAVAVPTAQFIIRGMAKSGFPEQAKRANELLTRIDEAAAKDGGALMYYLPSVCIGRKPEGVEDSQK